MNLRYILCLTLCIMVCSCASYVSDGNAEEKIEMIPTQRITDNNIPQNVIVLLPYLGKDNTDTLSHEEGLFLNTIYQIDTTEYSLIGKRVAFIPSRFDKSLFFKSAFDRHQRGSTYCVGTCALYILSDKQSNECNGYDVVITYWRKKILSYQEVHKSLKQRLDDKTN